MSPDLDHVVRAFRAQGDPLEAVSWGSGHIHDTWRVTTSGGRYLLQRVNHEVFADPAAVTESIRRVTEHVRVKLEAVGQDDVERRVLTLLRTHDGALCRRDDEGRWWRMFLFVDGARSHDVPTSPEMTYQAALAFGRFQHALGDLPLPRLPETLPGFHDIRLRFDAFRHAVDADAAGRVAGSAPEIEAVLAREEEAGLLLDAHAAGDVPERITHNDTKINNVLFDDATGEALCVIDLDTVMPGLGLYDFGDMVRTSTCTAPEDETDLGLVHARPDLFEGLARGYLEAMGEELTPTERDLLPFSGRLITLTIGLRFLTDHLQGDPYFKTHRPGHNLDRCRAQLALLRSLEAQHDAFREIVCRVR